MNNKTQAVSLAFGGSMILLLSGFNVIEWDWLGFLYVGFCTIIGFWNWIEIDKQNASLGVAE